MELTFRKQMKNQLDKEITAVGAFLCIISKRNMVSSYVQLLHVDIESKYLRINHEDFSFTTGFVPLLTAKVIVPKSTGGFIM